MLYKKEMIENIERLKGKLRRKDKVINDLLSRITNLEYEVERLERNNKKAIKYIENTNNFMIVHYRDKDLENTRKKTKEELLEILKEGNSNENG